MRGLGFCFGSVVAIFGLSVGAQQNPDFARLLTMYRGLNAEQAVLEFATWPDAQVLREVGFPENDLWSMAAASLLHLEAGLAAAGFRRDDRGLQAGRSLLAHAQVGATLIERMIPLARRDGDRDLLTFCRDWYLAVETVSQGKGGWWGGRSDLLPSIRRLLGSDSGVYLFNGASSASAMGPWRIGDGPYAVGHEFDLKGRRIPTLTADGETYNAEDVRDAETALRKALGLDPSLAEARLRLGRVLQLTNRRSTAEIEFKSILAAEGSADSLTLYLAGVFLGRIQEDAHRLADAKTSYEDAIRRYPFGVVARIALGQVLVALGRQVDGLAASRSVFGAETRPSRPDPWVGFPVANYGRVTQRLAAMRLQVSKTPLASNAADVTRAELAPRNNDVTPLADAPTVLPVEDRPLFRSTTVGIRIDALVTNAGRPVTGLSAADFVVTDRGRRQTVSSAATAGMLSLGLVLDTSQSVSVPGAQEQVRNATEALRTAMAPGDLLSIVTASDRLSLRADLIRDPTTLTALFAGIRSEPRTGTAIWDASLAAAALVADAPGRAFVAIISDGFDNGSWFARREAFTRLQRTGLPFDGIQLSPDYSGLGDADLAFGDVSLRPLEALTNGEFFEAKDPSLAAKLRTRYSTLRESYVLVYTPTNVGQQKGGWHDIKVSLRPGLRGKVQARSGYYEPVKR